MYIYRKLSSSHSNYTTILFIVLGVLLFTLSLYGDFGIKGPAIGGHDRQDIKIQDELVKAKAGTVRNIDDILKLAEEIEPEYYKLSEQDKMIVLYDIVTGRFIHCAGDNHTATSNWILWILGLIHPVLGISWNPDIWLRKADCLVCSQSSYLLMTLAIRVGINARHVGLVGHVVMEAWYQNDWHMFDPDMRVIPRDEQGDILSVEGLAVLPDSVKFYYSGDKSEAGLAILSRENNSFVSYPRGAYFEWKSQVMMYVEKILEIMKYLLPLVIIYIGYRVRRTI